MFSISPILMEVTPPTIGTFTDAVGQVFTAGVGWVAKVATTIGENPLLLLFAVVPLVGLGVGLFKRLMNV